MKKFILFSIVLFLSIGIVFAQKTAKLRLALESTPTPGSNFFMALYLDGMVNPDYPDGSIKTAQFGFTYDPAVLTPFDASGPGIKYYSNQNLMFTELSGTIANNIAAPGDLRFVLTQLSAPGWEPGYYGPYPIKLWDLNFTLAVGATVEDIAVSWQASKELIPIEIGVPGGDLAKIAPLMQDWINDYYTWEYLQPYPEPSTGIVWDGGGDAMNWFDPLNWDPNGLPGAGDDVIINAAKAPMVIITGGAATCGALTVANGAGINIVPTGSLTTNGVYTNNGQLIITSDGTGAAGSFIDGGGLAGTGTYEFDRFLVSGPSPFGWHLVSSPVNSTVSGDFVGYWVKEWNPIANSYFDIDPWGDGNAINCEPTDYSFGNVPMNVMQGYSVKQDLDYPLQPGLPVPCPVVIPATGNMIEFGGDVLGAYPGFGDFVPSATSLALMANVNSGGYAGNVNWLGGGLYSQWNLLGNPYSASIDNVQFTAGFPLQVNASIAYYDNNILNYVYWAAGVGSPFIPATQGFMVEVNTPGFAGVVNVNNLMRSHAGAGIYYKSEVNDLLTLQATGNGLSDVTYVRFLEEANASFDRSFDAHKLISDVEGVPQIYTTVGSEMLAINAMPATDAVPMTFVSKTSATYTIEAIETSEFATVILEDLATGIKTDLLAGSYSFEYTTGTNYGFVIHFAPLGTPELNANSINIWANDHKIYVQAPATTGDIIVYNMMGQEVVRTDIEAGLNVIPMNDANTYYIVKVIGSDVTETGKVFIK
jgi:hypothetical protein